MSASKRRRHETALVASAPSQDHAAVSLAAVNSSVAEPPAPDHVAAAVEAAVAELERRAAASAALRTRASAALARLDALPADGAAALECAVHDAIAASTAAADWQPAYKAKLRALLTALRGEANAAVAALLEAQNWGALARLGSRALSSESAQRDAATVESEAMSKAQAPDRALQVTGMVRCEKCGSNETAHKELAAPACSMKGSYVFVVCFSCGHRWKAGNGSQFTH